MPKSKLANVIPIRRTKEVTHEELIVCLFIVEVSYEHCLRHSRLMRAAHERAFTRSTETDPVSTQDVLVSDGLHSAQSSETEDVLQSGRK